MKNNNNNKGKWVYLEWEDHASGPTGWRDINDNMAEFEICFVKSCGIIVCESDDAIKITPSMEVEEKSFAGSMSILKSCVRFKIYLGYPPKARFRKPVKFYTQVKA